MYRRYQLMEKFTLHDFSDILQKLLDEEPSRPDAFLTQNEVDEITKSDDHPSPYKDGEEPVLCYPFSPFFKRICSIFYNWCLTGDCKCSVLPKFYMLEEGDYVEERRQKFVDRRSEVMGIPSLWSHWTPEEKVFKLRSILQALGGRRGVLDLLCMRQTVGTQQQLPAPRGRLLKSFEEACNDKTSLSQGARALTKHFHRDQTAAFWGSAKGTEADKNRHAREVVLKILDNAGWLNIHQLPGQLPIMEVRHVDGYGARWDPTGATFRGFLEPMQPEGWLNKYRH